MANDTSRRTTFTMGLNDVHHQPINVDVGSLVTDIKLGLEELGLEAMWLDPCTFLDNEGREGIAFGLSKFDQDFMVMVGRGEFRYKDTEVKQLLRDVIAQHPECTGEVRWNRGMGVFVFNVYVSPVKAELGQG